MSSIFIRQAIFILLLTTLNGLDKNVHICAICLDPMENEFSIDAWGNRYHSYHEQEGVFCSSCSRIISEKITKGGYHFPGGRFLCSLCQSSLIENEEDIHYSFLSVLKQLNSVGFMNIPKDLTISLINGRKLVELSSRQGKECLKGFTLVENGSSKRKTYRLFLLFGLPTIEFQAVLAHELLHVWLLVNQVKMGETRIEGFCNLGSALILENNDTKFAHIHLQSMNENPHPAYGDAYRSEMQQVQKIGWLKYIDNLLQLKQ